MSKPLQSSSQSLSSEFSSQQLDKESGRESPQLPTTWFAENLETHLLVLDKESPFIKKLRELPTEERQALIKQINTVSEGLRDIFDDVERFCQTINPIWQTPDAHSTVPPSLPRDDRAEHPVNPAEQAHPNPGRAKDDFELAVESFEIVAKEAMQEISDLLAQYEPRRREGQD